VDDQRSELSVRRFVKRGSGPAVHTVRPHTSTSQRLDEFVNHAGVTGSGFGIERFDAVAWDRCRVRRVDGREHRHARGESDTSARASHDGDRRLCNGRVQGRRHPVRVAAMVVLIILTMTLASGPRARRRPLVPSQDYGNANGARYVLGVAAAAIIARLSSRVPIRWVGGVIAVLTVILTALTTSKAATILRWAFC
jgi:hypothetical protein